MGEPSYVAGCAFGLRFDPPLRCEGGLTRERRRRRRAGTESKTVDMTVFASQRRGDGVGDKVESNVGVMALVATTPMPQTSEFGCGGRGLAIVYAAQTPGASLPRNIRAGAQTGA